MADSLIQTFLIVDDDPSVARTYTHGLSMRRGCREFQVATNPMRALDELRKTRHDMVLMDMRLSSKGQYDGIEAARAIRGLFDIPVVYLSAYSDPDTLLRVKESGDPIEGYAIKGEESSLDVTIEFGLHRSSEYRRTRMDFSFAVDKDLHVTSASPRMEMEVFGEPLAKTGQLPLINSLRGFQGNHDILASLAHGLAGNRCVFRLLTSNENSGSLEMELHPVYLGPAVVGIRAVEIGQKKREADFGPGYFLSFVGATEFLESAVSLAVEVFKVERSEVSVIATSTPFEPDDPYYEITIPTDLQPKLVSQRKRDWLAELEDRIRVKMVSRPALRVSLFRLNVMYK